MKSILVIDTSSERGILSLVNGTDIKHYIEFPFGLQSAQLLLPELKKASINLDRLEMIAVGVGPGSYTGIRMGAMVAKTLSYVKQIPLVGIGTLEGFIPQNDGVYASVIDAKIGGIYYQKGEKSGDLIHYTSEPVIQSLEQACEALRDIPQLVSPNIQPLQKKMTNTNWKWQESYPSPLQMAFLAKEKYKQGMYSLNGQLDLLYLRKTQAEIDKENTKDS